MKNQRGVTLIALVVTIIVLIIIAGIAIAALMGDNGVIKRSKEAKKEQIVGEVKDEIVLAVASAKMLAEQKTVENSGFSASKDLKGSNSANLIIADLREELPTTKGYTLVVGGTETAATVAVTYQTAAYKSATNISDAAITVTITVTGNKFEVGTYETNAHYTPPTGG